MAKPNQNQSAEQYNVAEDVARLRAERQDTMSNAVSSAAARVAETDRQHISPFPTPSKNVTASGNPELSQAVREQWDIPNEDNTKPKASLQDVQNIGQSLKEQGVTTSEGLQPESKAQMENRFDNTNGTRSSVTQATLMSETDKVTQQASSLSENPI